DDFRVLFGPAIHAHAAVLQQLPQRRARGVGIQVGKNVEQRLRHGAHSGRGDATIARYGGRMEYKIVGDVMQALQVQLHQNEELYAEAGAMLYMGPGIDLQARMQGGLMKGLMRKFLAGESLFMSVFRCDAASAHMALANPIAGKIIPIQLNGNTILAERNAYLCAIGNVDLSVAFTKRFGAGLF